MKPDNALVTWHCCGNRWDQTLTPLHPDRDMFQPLCETCGKTLLPALLQYSVEIRQQLGDKLLWPRRGVHQLASDLALIRLAAERTHERDREAEAREGLG